MGSVHRAKRAKGQTERKGQTQHHSVVQQDSHISVPSHSIQRSIKHSMHTYLLFLVIFSFVIPAIIAYVLVSNYFKGNPSGDVLWQVIVLIAAFFIYILIGWRKYSQHGKQHER